MVSRLFACISRSVLILLVLAIVPLDGVAANYYVSPTVGADANPGSQQQPWKTLAMACAQAQPGDTITLLAGTYPEAPLNFTTGGTADNPISIQAATGATVVLTYPASGPNMEAATWPNSLYAKMFKGKKVVAYQSVATLVASHLRFRGITFQGWRDKTSAVNIWAACSGIEICAAKDVVFQQCSFQGNGHCGVKLEMPTPSDILFEDCLIHDNGTTGFDHGFYIDVATRVTLRGNVIENNQGIAIKCDNGNPSYLTIENNTIRHNGEGILIAGHDIVVRGNVVSWNARKDNGVQEPYLGGLIFRGPSVANNLIENNQFFANAAELCFDDMGQGFGANNIVRNNTFNSQSINLATDGVASPNYPYSPVLTNAQAITVASSYGFVILGKTSDNIQELQSDLEDREDPAAFNSVTNPKKYKFVFEDNVFTTTSSGN